MIGLETHHVAAEPDLAFPRRVLLHLLEAEPGGYEFRLRAPLGVDEATLALGFEAERPRRVGSSHDGGGKYGQRRQTLQPGCRAAVAEPGDHHRRAEHEQDSGDAPQGENAGTLDHPLMMPSCEEARSVAPVPLSCGRP